MAAVGSRRGVPEARVAGAQGRTRTSLSRIRSALSRIRSALFVGLGDVFPRFCIDGKGGNAHAQHLRPNRMRKKLTLWSRLPYALCQK